MARAVNYFNLVFCSIYRARLARICRMERQLAAVIFAAMQPVWERVNVPTVANKTVLGIQRLQEYRCLRIVIFKAVAH
jgi:hypothetical protein